MAKKPKVPAKAVSRFVAQIAEGDASAKLLDAVPPVARTTDELKVYHGADAADRWFRLLVNHWRKLEKVGLSDAEIRDALAWLIRSLGDRRVQGGLPEDIWGGLLLRVEAWDQVALDRLHKMRKAMEAEGGADEAVDMFRWLMQRECGVNPKAEPRKYFAEAELRRMISIDILMRNHPAFRGTKANSAAIRSAREAVEKLMTWKNAEFELPRSAYPAEWEYPVGKTPIPSDQYGRALERAQLDRMMDDGTLTLLPLRFFEEGGGGMLDAANLSGRKARKTSETAGDWTSGKKYKGNFPHFDMLFEEAGTKFGQITHGDPVHLVNKYMRLFGMVDRRLDGAETQAFENLRKMGYINGTGQAAIDDMRRRSYLFVPHNQVEGLRALIAGNPNFEILLKRLGLTADDALDRIRPIGPF